MTTAEQINEAVHTWKGLALHYMTKEGVREKELPAFAVDSASVEHLTFHRDGGNVVFTVGMAVREGMGS